MIKMCKKTKFLVDWETTGLLLEQLKKKIKKDGEEFSGIYGIPRGGKLLELYLSHHLNLPVLSKPNKECLLVDDISDEGITSKNYPRKKFACLYSTPWSFSKPDYFVKMKNNKNSWIVFAWEDFSEDGVKNNVKRKTQKTSKA